MCMYSFFCAVVGLFYSFWRAVSKTNIIKFINISVLREIFIACIYLIKQLNCSNRGARKLTSNMHFMYHITTQNERFYKIFQEQFGITTVFNKATTLWNLSNSQRNYAEGMRSYHKLKSSKKDTGSPFHPIKTGHEFDFDNT